MKYYCEICGEQLDLHEVDGMMLCDDCDADYYQIDLPDSKLFRFSRMVHKNLLEPKPQLWHFKYELSFDGHRLFSVKFDTGNRLAKWIWIMESPFCRASVTIKRWKNGLKRHRSRTH